MLMPRVTSGRIHRVGERSYYVESLPEAASNAGIVVGDDALTVVDSRLTPSLGAELRQVVTGMAHRPPRQLFLVNTHFHGDHWFGNSGFPDAVVVASEWTRATLTRSWQEQVEIFTELRPQQAGDFDRVSPALPVLGVTGQMQVDLGGCAVALRCAPPAHTPGDLLAQSVDDDVLFAGDLVFNGHWPVLWDADVVGWLRCLDELRERPFRTVIPGHGPAGGPELVSIMIDCLQLLRTLAEVSEARRQELISTSPFRDWLHGDRVAPAVRRIRSHVSTQ